LRSFGRFFIGTCPRFRQVSSASVHDLIHDVMMIA
jgi:hypothetical protein